MNWFYKFLTIKNFIWINTFDHSTKTKVRDTVRARQIASQEFAHSNGSFFFYIYLRLRPPWTETTRYRVSLIVMPLAYILVPARWYDNTRIFVTFELVVSMICSRIINRWVELKESFLYLQGLWVNDSPYFFMEFIASDFGYYTLFFMFLTAFWVGFIYGCDGKRYFK